MFKCPYCETVLYVNQGIVETCLCEEARTMQITERERLKTWNKERKRLEDESRTNKTRRKPVPTNGGRTKTKTS